jgi:hypothetical protein
MQRPENYGLLAILFFTAGVLMLAVALGGHVWGRHVVRHGRYRAVRICVPPLLMLLVVALFIIIPGSFASFYDASYGYQLQPDETAGPMGSTGGIIVLLLWPFGFVLLLVYGLVLLSYGIFRFFRWLGEGVPGQSNFDV